MMKLNLKMTNEHIATPNGHVMFGYIQYRVSTKQKKIGPNVHIKSKFLH